MYWYEKENDPASPVLSTRVRFARNLEDTPFPHLLSADEKAKVFERVKTALAERDMFAVDFEKAEELVRQTYVQTRLASPLLLKVGAGAGLILSKEGDLSVMVNEEDHLRIQALLPGKKIRECFTVAKDTAAFLEEKLPFAYRDGLGYLTSCPTNLGAAMRLSVMIHLPALKTTGRLSALIRSLNDAGYTLRGAYGEGSRSDGDVFQISNQMSRARQTEEIVSDFERVIELVILEENKSRDALLEARGAELEDRIFRAVGTAKYARRLSYSEFLELYSVVRLGMEAGLKDFPVIPGLDRLLVELMPAPMALRDAENRSPEKRDLARAKILREKL